ncbi:MAG TPA: UrcA family protein [Povalibacter sp.]
MSIKSSKDSAIHATSMHHLMLTAIGVTALSLVAVNVRAQTVVPQVSVSLAGLNLATQHDAKTAYSKLRSAAKSVCHNLESRDPRGRQVHEQCYQDSLARAVDEVDNGNITALHQSDRTVRIAQRGGMDRS